ncbi:type IV secretory system conjugative DNA transfer family protein [Paratractidigestivibacter faecalis]|uniref:type IV secretory system conjugative DNA transfer family protein n=1 Tax=Paratractidigestivibacter faecalis TaxID=2292441 RepID=UPI000E3B69EA|nr:type IV secretory system conjugative DNA transfer family protein [Paratractidigestivibacter faecalis]
MNPSAIAAGVTAAALALASCPALAGPLEELAGGGTPDLVAAVAAIDPAAAPAWWLSGDGASHPVGCLLALAACSTVAAAIALSAAAPRREGNGGVLGDARVRSGRDAVRGSCTWDGRHDPAGRDLVYGYSGGRERRRHLYEPGRFCLVDGSTGSGKTRYMLIPTIDLLTYGGASRGSEPHTIVVTDVKGELLELTGDELARRGYEVLLLDAARPARGQRFNPLRQVLDLYSAGMPDEAEQAADGVAESLVPDDRDGAASHWVASARSLLSAVILLVCPDGARTMGTVAAVACRGTEGEGDDPCAPLRSLLRSLPGSHPARPRASQFLSSGGNELGSIVSTLKAAIRAYGSAPMAWLTSGSKVDPNARRPCSCAPWTRGRPTTPWPRSSWASSGRRRGSRPRRRAAGSPGR